MLRTLYITLITVLAGTLAPAMAAVEERDPPHNYAIWVFLGFCALIVVAQLATLMKPDPHKRSPGMNKGSEHLKAH